MLDQPQHVLMVPPSRDNYLSFRVYVIVVPVENRNGRLPKFDFTRVLYVGPNVGSSALYSASDALYSALLPTLGLTYRTRVKSNFGSQLISAFYRTDNTPFLY